MKGDYRSDRNISRAIELLENEGCPSELLKPIAEWASQPVPNLFKLEAWKLLCGVSK